MFEIFIVYVLMVNVSEAMILQSDDKSVRTVIFRVKRYESEHLFM